MDNMITFNKIGKKMSQKSNALQDIVGREFRKIERITGKTSVL